MPCPSTRRAYAAQVPLQRRTKKILIGTAVVLVLAVGAPLAWVAISFSGGVDEIFRRSIDPRGDRVQTARRAAQAQVLEGTDRLLMTADLRLQAGRRRTLDACERGEHNFKIDDDFDLSCAMASRTSVVVPFDERDSARGRLEAAARTAGWTSAGRGFQGVQRFERAAAARRGGTARLEIAFPPNDGSEPYLGVSGDAFSRDDASQPWTPPAEGQAIVLVTIVEPYFEG